MGMEEENGAVLFCVGEINGGRRVVSKQRQTVMWICFGSLLPPPAHRIV